MCGFAAIVVALPTVIWRVLVGLGATLGTPASWRRSEELPGSGTSYVIGLSALQLTAALLTLVLVVADADRVPRWSPVAAGRRMPRGLIVGMSLLGAIALTAICTLSAINWGRVDPFRDAPAVSGWSVLCWACYGVALAWPVLLIATTLGYSRSRRRPSTA